MRALLASTLSVMALGASLVTTVDAAAGPFAKRTSLKAVIFLGREAPLSKVG